MKDFLKIVVGILLFIAITVGVLTVTRNFTRQPSILLTSTECDPPCWYGIHPGRSNSSQVYAILDNINGVNKDAIMGDYNREDELTTIYWLFQRPVEDSAGSVYLDDDRVTAIKILTVNSLNLADIFDKLGQPEEYWTEIGHGENREYLEVILLYPTKGYLVEVIIEIKGSANQVEIQAATPVFRATYFAPELFQELMETRILFYKSVSARTGTYQPWSGFGTIFFERK